MKKQTIFLLLCLFACFAACNKTADGVFIRIENSTPQKFKEVFTNNKSFANVNASAVTSYELFDKAVGRPSVRLITTNDDTAFAGVLYNDLPVTYLSNGKYTLKVFVDTTFYYGYNCMYIKN